jgi:hypothetical protein
MKFFTPIQLSKNQYKTPEGFLVCLGAAIARTGSQDYTDQELDVPASPEGIIRVERDEKQVFSAETIASAEGKDIVITHPSEDVKPDNWKELTVGHMQNVRRGEGAEDHLLLADLIFKDPRAIEMIEQNPHQELSCGYDAQYEVMGPGRAAQCNIRINHVAMVDRGRCGPVCATKDHLPVDLWHTSDTAPKQSDTLAPVTDGNEGNVMAKGWADRIRDAFKSRDEKALDAAVADAAAESASVMKKTGNPDDNEDHTHIHLHLGGPETTKPEGGLPETGETRVSNAADAAQVGGEQAATFEGKTFFADAEMDAAFKHEMKEMKDSIKKIGDGFEGFMKERADKKAAKEAKKAEDAAKCAADAAAGTEANKAILPGLKEEAPPGTEDAAIEKARDSVFLEESFAKTISQAAILVPSIAIPTFDSALDPAQTYSAICALRRKALDGYMATEEGAKTIKTIAPTAKTFDSCPCRDVAPIFRAAAAMQSERNDAAKMRGFTPAEAAKMKDAAPIHARTIADVQKLNEEYWAAQNSAAQA